jgi:hypothetical protein
VEKKFSSSCKKAFNMRTNKFVIFTLFFLLVILLFSFKFTEKSEIRNYSYRIHSLKSSLAQKDLVVDVSKFGARCNDGSDVTLAVREALDYCRKTKSRKLVFPKGQYYFSPSLAFEKYYSISNNDGSLKRIAFPIIGFDNFEIDGQGSEFVFKGFICPFIIDSSSNISIRNFSIDYKRTFHSEANIISVRENEIDASISVQYPYTIENGRIVFRDENKTQYPFGNLLEFDPKKRETAFLAKDYYTGPNVHIEEIEKQVVRIFLKGIKATPGNVMVFGAGHRLCPAVTITDAKGITINQLDIFHCGGMGVIAQRSKDISLEKVRITTSPKSGRVVSITADATHFSNCTGNISMTDCLFENQKDDATNIHGIYVRVDSQLTKNIVLVKLVHAQQFGFDFITEGKKLELVNKLSLTTYKELTVRSVVRINSEFTKVEFTEPLPADFKIGDVLASVEYPDVVIKNCIIRGNRARGILLGSRGKILIEGNTFHVPGAAILLEGDARFWFEQAGVRNLEIRNNNFDNCNYGVWGNAVIQVGAGIEKNYRESSRYNKNIIIENNVFHIFDPRILNAYSIDNLVFRNNKMIKSVDYPAQNTEAEPFIIVNSSNVKIEK